MSSDEQRPLLDLEPRYDAIVVGARAAGAATAMLLARCGLRVLAVDRNAHGSDTLSTHALMRGALSRLARWGLLDRIWAAGTPVIRTAAFHYGDEELRLDVPPTESVPGLAAPRRTLLDPVLVDAARAAGAVVRHDTRFVDCIRTADDRVCGAIVADADGSTHRLEADLLIGADGLHSAVARSVMAPVTRQGSHASAYILRHVADADLPMDEYQWRYRLGLGAGVIPTNGEAWCVFAALPPAAFRDARADTATTMEATMLTSLAAIDPHLAEAVAGARPVSPLRSWPGVPGRFRAAHGPGWALVGDAGYFKDPFAAHGISDAFRDAELLAEAVVDGDLDRYERRRDELSAPLFDVLEQIASYEWDLDVLPRLHFQLATAMRDEEAKLRAMTSAKMGP